MDLDRKLFIAIVSTISEQLYRFDGALLLCTEISDFFGYAARNHFEGTMRRLYWPIMATIGSQLSVDGKFEGLDESEEDALKLETRLKCLNEWKELVLKDELYKEF